MTSGSTTASGPSGTGRWIRRARGSSLAIETRGLTKHFGERTALDGVDLHVPRGSAFGFLGPNGAGKTTMIRTLLGLTHASSGEMQLLGHPVPAERAQALERVGAIVEEPRFHMYLTGRENLSAGRRRARPRGRRADRAGAGPRRARRPRAARRSRATRWACASASASRAACWLTRCC